MLVVLSLTSYGQVSPDPEPIECESYLQFFQVIKGKEFTPYFPATPGYGPTINLNTNANFLTNAIGYNIADQFIYGISSANHHLIKIGKDGAFNDLGSIGLPFPNAGAQVYYSGDCDDNGNLYVYDSNNPTIFKISLTGPNFTVTTINCTTPSTHPKGFVLADFSYHPGTGKFYGLENVTSKLVSIEITSGNTGIMEYAGPNQGLLSPFHIGDPSFTNSQSTYKGYGASYVAGNDLYFFQNETGDLYKVELQSTPPLNTTLHDQTNIVLTKNDGASCPYLCCGGDNLIENGDFEAGNVGFQSDYDQNFQVSPNQYTIIHDADAQYVCREWDVTDQSACSSAGSNNHQIMVVNGQTQQTSNQNNAIWQTAAPVSITPNDHYYFCFYAKHLAQCCFDVIPDIQVEISVNGSAYTPLAFSPATTVVSNGPNACDWDRFVTYFFSPGTSSNVEFRILLDETGNGDGNDLALDDIFLGVGPPPKYCLGDDLPKTAIPTDQNNDKALDINTTTNEISDFVVYPNPFSDQTTIEYSLQNEGHVNLSIVDISGKRVRHPINRKQLPGKQQLQLNTSDLPPGIYQAKLEINNQSSTIKLVIVKE